MDNKDQICAQNNHNQAKEKPKSSVYIAAILDIMMMKG